jgi:hypothetical protein
MRKRILRTTAVLAAAAAWAAVSCENTPTDTEGAYKGPWKAYKVLQLPAGRAIKTVYMFSSVQAWAIAEGPSFIYFNGPQWYLYSYGDPKSSNAELFDLSFTSREDGWAAGYLRTPGEESWGKGIVYHFDGKYWEDVSPPDIDPLFCIFALAPDDVWAGGDRGLYHYDGAVWTHHDVYADDVISLDFPSPNAAWAATRGNLYLRWDGTTWELNPVEEGYDYVSDVYCPSSTEAWSVGHGRPTSALKTPPPPRQPSHPIYRWNDETAAWEPYRKFTGKDDHVSLNSVHFISPDDGWAVGNVVLHYDGTDWKWVSAAPGNGANCVFSTWGNDVWIGAADGKMYKYDPGTPE